MTFDFVKPEIRNYFEYFKYQNSDLLVHSMFASIQSERENLIFQFEYYKTTRFQFHSIDLFEI